MWTCGYIYEQKALQALGGIESVGAALEQRGHTAVQQARVAGSRPSRPGPNLDPHPDPHPDPTLNRQPWPWPGDFDESTGPGPVSQVAIFERRADADASAAPGAASAAAQLPAAWPECVAGAVTLSGI